MGINRKENFYTALYGPEAMRGELAKMLGTVPMIIGNGSIPDYQLIFSHRRGGGIVPSMVRATGKSLDVMVFWLQYYELRRLERRLGYPIGIRRATFDGLIEDRHPTRMVAYYVPENREHGQPSERMLEQMKELYAENAWNAKKIEEALKLSESARPKLTRIK